MVNPVYIGAGIELVRMALQLWLSLAAQAGMSDEQMDVMLEGERNKFEANKPENLPPPPCEE
jgi:hypothetical protein